MLGALAMFALLSLLVADYSIRLPSGYELVRVYGHSVLLTGSDGAVVLHPDVDGYSVHGNVVVGHVSRNRFEPEGRPGYFIVDTETDKLEAGLDEGTWLRYLRSYGIHTRPTLVTPGRWRVPLEFVRRRLLIQR